MSAMTTTLPPEKWDELQVRLRDCAAWRSCQQGVTVLHVRLILHNGRLIAWYTPEAERVEPLHGSYPAYIAGILAGEGE